MHTFAFTFFTLIMIPKRVIFDFPFGNWNVCFTWLAIYFCYVLIFRLIKKLYLKIKQKKQTYENNNFNFRGIEYQETFTSKEMMEIKKKIEKDIEAAEKAIAQNNQVWAMYKSAQKKSNTLIYVTGFLALVGVLSSSFILAAVGIVGLVASFIYSSKSLHLNDLETEAKKDSPEELLELHEQLKLQQGKKKDARELCRIKEEYEQLTKELNETNAFI